MPQITTLTSLSEALADAPELPVVFTANGGTISAGYHITELKHATINAIDCSGSSSSWVETTVQLMDGHGHGGHMPGSQMAKILGQSQRALPDLAKATLRFEFALGNGALQVFSTASASLEKDQIRIDLTPDRAVCKPMASGRCGTGVASGDGQSSCC